MPRFGAKVWTGNLMGASWLFDASVSLGTTTKLLSVHIGKNMPTDDYSTDPAARSDMATHLARGLAHQACTWRDISSVVPCQHRTLKQGQQLSKIPSKVVNIKLFGKENSKSHKVDMSVQDTFCSPLL